MTRTARLAGVALFAFVIAATTTVSAQKAPFGPFGPAGGHTSAVDDSFERGDQYEYRVLATLRTSTMERELNDAAAEGYRFKTVMGGETAVGGDELVSVMAREPASPGRYAYRLLATSRTSTMERELNDAWADGFQYRGQTVYESAFGGEEVVVIMERRTDTATTPHEYVLLATSLTSTLEKELAGAGADGYAVKNVSVGETAFGGDEVVAVLERPVMVERLAMR